MNYQERLTRARRAAYWRALEGTRGRVEPARAPQGERWLLVLVVLCWLGVAGAVGFLVGQAIALVR